MHNVVSRPTLTRRRFTQLSGMAVGSLALSGAARGAGRASSMDQDELCNDSLIATILPILDEWSPIRKLPRLALPETLKKPKTWLRDGWRV